MLTLLTRFAVLACLMVSLMLWCPGVFAQKSPPDITINLDAKNLTLAELLETISKQSGIPFSYNPKKIPVDQKITYNAVNKSLSSILDDLSAQFGLRYALIENQIVLSPEKKPEKTAGQNFTLSGYVKDTNSGEALIGATIVIQELQAGTSSNAFGFFSITIPAGKYSMVASFIGYKNFTTTIDPGSSSVQMDIALLQVPPVLQEIIVHDTPPDIVEEIQSGKINIRPKAVEERPALFGETDVVKSLESVPGIKLNSDGSTFYYVRGGNRDQNLVLIDDAPIYNPSHLLGLFSTIIPDAVNDINVYKGTMPASLGGRLSSVLDIRTKKGNDQHMAAWGNAGLISTKLGLEGPIKKNKSSFLVSARVSRLKWFFHLLDNNITRFNFYDVTAKMNFRLNEANRIFFSFYTGGDNYFASNSGIAWANTAGTFRWNHTFSDRLFLNTTVAASSYNYFLYADVAQNTRWTSHISNFNLKTDFTYFIKPQNEFTFGWSINGYNFNPGNFTSNVQVALPSISTRNAAEFVMYGNHEIKLGNHWGLNYGLRLSSWNDVGPSFEFVFDKNGNPVDTVNFKKGQTYKKYINAEPRFTLSYQVNEKSSIKASLARNVQNIHLISNSTSPFTSMEVWLPSSINIQPQVANQATLGYYRSLSVAGASLVAETFYKKMTHQIDYSAHAETFLNPTLENQLVFGNAIAYGVELLAKKDEGRLRGLVGYSYSRAKRKFDDLNLGQSFNAFYDRPNQVNLMLAYDLTLRWNVGMNWNYSTGAPYSSPISFYTFNGLEVPIYGQKNNDRLPAYHRLDLSATVRLNKNAEKKFHHSFTFSIFNAYGRKNVLFVNYNKSELTDGTFKIPSNLLDASRMTSQFYLFGFTPSVSYNFKWL